MIEFYTYGLSTSLHFQARTESVGHVSDRSNDRVSEIQTSAALMRLWENKASLKEVLLLKENKH